MTAMGAGAGGMRRGAAGPHREHRDQDAEMGGEADPGDAQEAAAPSARWPGKVG